MCTANNDYTAHKHTHEVDSKAINSTAAHMHTYTTLIYSQHMHARTNGIPSGLWDSAGNPRLDYRMGQNG